MHSSVIRRIFVKILRGLEALGRTRSLSWLSRLHRQRRLHRCLFDPRGRESGWGVGGCPNFRRSVLGYNEADVSPRERRACRRGTSRRGGAEARGVPPCHRKGARRLSSCRSRSSPPRATPWSRRSAGAAAGWHVAGWHVGAVAGETSRCGHTVTGGRIAGL